MTDRNRPSRRRAPSVAGRKGRRTDAVAGDEPRARVRQPSFVVPASAPAQSATGERADVPPPAPGAAPVAAPTAGDAVAAPGPLPGPASGPARRRAARATVVLAPVAMAAVVALVVLLVTGLTRHDRWVHDQRAAEAARVSAAAAARTAAGAVLSYDYRHFASDVAKADGYLTGKLRADYDKLQRTSVGPTAQQVHATVTATVQGTAVLAATKTSATVLVFVDQRSTNTRIAAPRLDENRVTMQLVRSGGRWLVSAFDAI